METRTRPPPRFRPQMANPGCHCRVSPSARSPYYGPFRVSFWAPLTWLTAFRSAYLGPQLASLSITHWLTGGHDKQILDSLMHCGPMATVYAFGGGRSWVVKEFAGRAGSAGQQGMGGRFVPPPIFSGRPCASNRRADRQSPVGSGALRKLGATARPVVPHRRRERPLMQTQASELCPGTAQRGQSIRTAAERATGVSRPPGGGSLLFRAPQPRKLRIQSADSCGGSFRCRWR